MLNAITDGTARPSRWYFRLLAGLLATTAAAVVGALMVPLTAAAHSGQPILELSADRATAGGVIEVLGDVGWGDRIEFRLVGAGRGGAPIGVLTDLEEAGHFDAWLTIPADVGSGAYRLEATNGEVTTSAPIEISAGAVAQESDDLDSRDRPDPTAGVVALVSIAPDPDSASTGSREAAMPARGDVQPVVLILAGLVAAVVVAVLGTRVVGRRGA